MLTRIVYAAFLAGTLATLAPAAVAQRGGRSMAHPMQHGGFGEGFGSPPMGTAAGAPNARDPGNTSNPMRQGLQLGPPGRWWDDKGFAKSLKLRPDQQRRMDSIFDQNRAVLLKRFQDLQTEQSRMETLVHAKAVDEASVFAQIDRIAQARADLEKANTHLLLQLRGEMDANQISRLEQQR